MKDKLIQDYISRITLDDVQRFALNNGITLESSQLQLVYGYIVKDWRTIIYGNPRGILDDLQKRLNAQDYAKVEQLYIQFKNRYL